VGSLTAMRILDVLEVIGFGALTASAATFGYVTGGGIMALASGLAVGGLSTVYLVNAYGVAEADDAEPD